MPEENIAGDIGTIAIALGVAVIIITLTTILVQTMRDDTNIVPDNTADVRNETFTWTNGSFIDLRQRRIVENSERVYNQTSGACCYRLLKNSTNLLTGSNYSMDYANGQIRINNQSTGVWNTSMNISYSYYIGSAARNATNYGLEGQNTFASFLPIAAMAAAGALIIGIALRFFMRKREGEL